MMKYVFTTVLALFLLSSWTYANTWIGGNGYWNNPANWSDGSVPTANDEVIIPAGSVEIPSGYTAYAQRVRLYNNTNLTISSGGGRLIVDASASTISNGVVIDGSLDVYGFLLVRDVHFGYGISTQNNSQLYVHGSGYLTVKNNTDNDGIFIEPNGNFINEGYTFISDISNAGIRNYGMLSNSSKISVLSASSGILNSGGILNNSGLINVKGTSGGAVIVHNGGQGENGPDGEIISSYVESGVLVNSSDAYFENSGFIQAEWQIERSGVHSLGTFINMEEGVISINNSDEDGIETGSIGEFINYGAVTIGPQIQEYAIDNIHEIHNEVCGVITIHSPVHNRYSTSLMQNEGIIYNYNTSGTSINTGDIFNDGIIEDNPETLLSYVANDEAIVTALTGNVEVGVPVNNMLDLGNVNHYIIKGCYTSPALNAIAGSYNVNTNQWTPNAAAEGLTAVYLHVGYRQNFTTLCTAVIEVQIPNGVQPFSAPSPFGQAGGVSIEKEDNYLVYPNPFRHNFQLQTPRDMEGEYALLLYDATGQQVFRQNIDLVPGEAISPNLPALAQGTYLLSLNKDGAVAWTKRLVKLP